MYDAIVSKAKIIWQHWPVANGPKLLITICFVINAIWKVDEIGPKIQKHFVFQVKSTYEIKFLLINIQHCSTFKIKFPDSLYEPKQLVTSVDNSSLRICVGVWKPLTKQKLKWTSFHIRPKHKLNSGSYWQLWINIIF